MAQPLDVIRLTDKIHYMPADHQFDRPILAAVFGQRKTLLLDAGASPAHVKPLLDHLSGLGRSPDWVALTHWHWDHTFGLCAVDAESVAHRNLRVHLERLQPLAWDDASLDARVQNGEESPFCADMLRKEYGEARDVQVVLPTVLFEDTVSIDLGGITCELVHVPTDHTDDSVVMWIPEERTLFVGDAVGPQFYAPAPYYTPKGILELFAALRRFPAECYLESHGIPTDRVDFWEQNAVCEAAALAVSRGVSTRRDLALTVAAGLGHGVPDEDLDVIDGFVAGLEHSGE